MSTIFYASDDLGSLYSFQQGSLSLTTRFYKWAPYPFHKIINLDI